MKHLLTKWALIVLGTISWSWTMVKSGWLYSYGMGFWGANGHDGIWHLALIESLSRSSWGMPTFGGKILQNYHIGFDLLLALIHRITFIPVVNLYFQIIPIVLALTIGLLVYQFIYEWTKSKEASLWSVFFAYFGGNFGWVLGKGESAFWSQQSVSSLINPSFALSLVLILAGLLFLLKYQIKQNLKYLIISSILFGILIEVKAYAGILVLGGLLTAGLYSFLKNKELGILKIFLLSLVISIIIFLPFNKNSASLFVWQPFWFLETMMGLPDRLNWLRFYSAMMTYKSGHIFVKLIPAYLVAAVIFYVGNLGTRILKEFLVWKWIKNFKSTTWVQIFISFMIVDGVLIPMFFLQKGTPWNTIQFFYYSLFFSGILAGLAIDDFIKNSKLNKSLIRIILILIVLLTIPTTIITLKDVYIPGRPPAKLTNNELSALNFLSKEPAGIVLTYPFDLVASKDAESKPPRPLYLYTSTAYVSAFSKHDTFLEDEINLDITGYDWQSRRAEVEAWYKDGNAIKARAFLKDNNIKYIYLVKGQKKLLGEEQLGIKNIFENSEVIIYHVETE